MAVYNIILHVDLEPDEVPADRPGQWEEWAKIAKNEIIYGEVYDVRPVVE